MMSINFSNLAICNIQRVDYRWIINKISKSEPVNLLQNVGLRE